MSDGADSFSATSGTLTIPVGSASATLTLVPVADPVLEADETATLTVLAGAGYLAGSPAAGLSGPNAQPGATPFHDGVPNLLKYAFNMNLTGPDRRTLVPTTGTAGLPVVREVPPRVRYEFLRRHAIDPPTSAPLGLNHPNGPVPVARATG